jgi:hypothetical protein
MTNDMATVGELVRSTSGAWMVRPPTHCPRGHRLRPDRMLVGSIACSCGRHLTWRCDCGAVTYGPALAEGCSLLDGPARVRTRLGLGAVGGGENASNGIAGHRRLRLASDRLTTEHVSRRPVSLLPSGYRSSPFLPSCYFYLAALPPGDPTVMFRPSKLSAA